MTESGPQTVAEAFVRSVGRFPDRTAIVTLEGEAISYLKLGADVAKAVSVLRKLGCGPGDRIAIWLPNRAEWAVLQYAAALLGLCVIPVNTRYRAGELEHALRLGKAKILFTQERFLTNDYIGRLTELAGGALGSGGTVPIGKLPFLEHVVLFDGGNAEGIVAYEQLSEAVPPAVDIAALARERSPDEPLWIFWTSGTTSAPKGAILLQSAIVNVWNWTAMAGYRADDRVLMSRPLFYIAGNFWSMLGPMLHGAAAIVGQKFTPDEMMSLCKRERVTILSGNPLLLKSLVNDPGFDPSAFAHARFGYFGGASVSHSDLEHIKKRIGFAYLLQCYGMTELEGFATSTRLDDPIDVTIETCGHALPGLEMRLVDPETGETVPQGKTGVLMTRGRGFVDYEGITAEDRAKLFDSDGWFRTGDLLRQREDGRYEFIGRAKDLIKVGGENVTAAEIEMVLLSHPRIAQAAVVPITDERRGELPVAFVELEPGQPLDLAELRAWCRARMAPFKVPVAFQTVGRDQWPMTSSGKIAKHKLLMAPTA